MNVSGGTWPLTILGIEAADGRVEARVAAAPDAMRTSTVPGLSSRLLLALPGLVSHECENDVGSPFVEELRDTETAHALEHAALQLLRMAGVPGVRGETRWDFRQGGRGRYRVAISGAESAVAEEALRSALEFVGAAAGGGEMPNAASEAARIRAAAGVAGGRSSVGSGPAQGGLRKS